MLLNYQIIEYKIEKVLNFSKILPEFENYAFIDSQNLYFGLREIGWSLDFKRFRVYLAEKYGVKKAYFFIGYLSENKKLYQKLREAGFVLVFKPTLKNVDGEVKGNCDAELVLQAMIDFQQYKKAVIVSGDGDFYCLIKYLDSKNKFAKLLAPSHTSCSSLLRKLIGNRITFFNDPICQKICYKKPRSDRGKARGNIARTEP